MHELYQRQERMPTACLRVDAAMYVYVGMAHVLDPATLHFSSTNVRINKRKLLYGPASKAMG